MVMSNSPESTHQGPAFRPRMKQPGGRIRTHHLQQTKDNGHHSAMFTAYEQYTAEILTERALRYSSLAVRRRTMSWK